MAEWASDKRTFDALQQRRTRRPDVVAYDRTFTGGVFVAAGN